MPGPGRPFQQGNRANPGGRPKTVGGFVAYVKEQTNDGKEMVDLMVSVMRGEPQPTVLKTSPTGEETVVLKTPSIETRMLASGWLADRAFGKPAQKLEGELRVPLTIVHRTPRHDPLAPKPDEERALDVEATLVPPRRALKG
jgi:hypothetical protein